MLAERDVPSAGLCSGEQRRVTIDEPGQRHDDCEPYAGFTFGTLEIECSRQSSSRARS